jgi:hypothetical protein
MPILGANSSGGSRPSTPTIGTASDGGTGTTVSVAFTPSSYIGKGTITYTATSSPGSFTGTSSSSPITVTGLTTGTAYTFTVQGTTNYGVTSALSAASNSVTPAVPPTFELIQTTSLSSSASSIDFSLGSNSFTDLYMILNARTDVGGDKDQLLIQFNGDTTASNYSSGYNAGDGSNSSFSSLFTRTTSAAGLRFAGLPGNGSSSGTRGALEIDFFNVNSPYFKTVLAYGGFTDLSSTPVGTIGAYNGSWRNTAVLTSIALKAQSNGNFMSGSTFSLYGMRRSGGGGF